jgi:hypothetical protein
MTSVTRHYKTAMIELNHQMEGAMELTNLDIELILYLDCAQDGTTAQDLLASKSDQHSAQDIGQSIDRLELHGLVWHEWTETGPLYCLNSTLPPLLRACQTCSPAYPIEYRLLVALDVGHDPASARYPKEHPMSERHYTKLENHLSDFEFSGDFGDIRILGIADIQEILS